MSVKKVLEPCELYLAFFEMGSAIPILMHKSVCDEVQDCFVYIQNTMFKLLVYKMHIP